MRKWLLIGVGLLAGLAVAAIVAVPWLLDTPAVRAQVAQAVSHALGRPVRFASLSVSALPVPTVRLRDLRVAEDPAFGADPFVTAGEGRIRVRLSPLLSGRVELADLTLMGPSSCRACASSTARCSTRRSANRARCSRCGRSMSP